LTPQVQPNAPQQSQGGASPAMQNILRQLVPSSEGNTQRPKIWGEGEINGWKYYIIPCADGTGGSPQTAPPKVVSPK
jgi:hypothetical protein